MWLEADRLATLPKALTQQKLDNQREVVRNERRQSFENQPYGAAYSLIQENPYPSGHPYSWFVIGSHEDLIAASLDDVRAFFRNYYVPNNLSLVIAGDFAPTEARRLVEKYFGGIAPGPAIKRAKRWVPQLAGEKVIEVSDRVPAGAALHRLAFTANVRKWRCGTAAGVSRSHQRIVLTAEEVRVYDRQPWEGGLCGGCAHDARDLRVCHGNLFRLQS